MSKEPDLFGKTFDQQLAATSGDIVARDIAPNRRIPAEIVFEPTGGSRGQSDHIVIWV